MASQENLTSAFSAMLGGLPDISEPIKNEEPTKIKEVVKEDPKPVINMTSAIIQKKPVEERRDKRKQFLLTPTMCEKLKRYSTEYGMSENEIICQLIEHLP